MRDFDEILAQCLDDIYEERDTIEGCLARYPDLAPRLEPLLRTATAIRSLPPANPSPIFRATARTRLLNRIGRNATTRGAAVHRAVLRLPGLRWGTALARGLAGLAIATLLVGGTAFAAQDSPPDSPLYPVRLVTEDVRLTLTPQQGARARLMMELADRHVAAIIKLSWDRRLMAANAAADRYTLIVRGGVSIMLERATRSQDLLLALPVVQNRLAAQERLLANALPKTPPGMRAPLERALQANREAQDRLASLQP